MFILFQEMTYRRHKKVTEAEACHDQILQRLSPPPSRDRPRERRDPVAPLAPEPEPEVWPRRRTERPTGRRGMAETRPELPDLAPLPWSSEEDLVVASLSLSNFLVSSVCHLLKQNKH